MIYHRKLSNRAQNIKLIFCIFAFNSTSYLNCFFECQTIYNKILIWCHVACNLFFFDYGNKIEMVAIDCEIENKC